MLKLAEEYLVDAVRRFLKLGGTAERVLHILAEATGQESVSVAGHALRAHQTTEGSNAAPTARKFNLETQRLEAAKLQKCKMAVTRNFLKKVMPNGKELRDCTGNDCTRMGGWFLKIAERVKPTQKVGNALSEEDVQNLMAKAA